jgi:valyl-tRNA synthetase
MGKGFEAYGTDALRFTLASYSTVSKRIPLSPKKIEGYRHFCNKIWNATRFALPHTEGAEHAGASPAAQALTNRWILSRLGAACAAAEQGIDEFRFDEAASALYRFFWGELCDWYLELCKPVFAGEDLPGVAADEMARLRAETRDTLAYTLETSVRALHPFMPFITEELWHRLPRPEPSPVSIALAPAPGRDAGPEDGQAERDMAVVQAVITAARTVRSERQVHPGARVPVTLRTDEQSLRELLDGERYAIETLVKADGSLTLEGRGGARPPGAALTVAAGVEVLITLKGIVDGAKEKERVDREIKKTQKDIDALDKKLANKGFAERAPAEVVAEAQAALESARERLQLLGEALELAAELE